MIDDDWWLLPVPSKLCYRRRPSVCLFVREQDKFSSDFTKPCRSGLLWEEPFQFWSRSYTLNDNCWERPPGDRQWWGQAWDTGLSPQTCRLAPTMKHTGQESWGWGELSEISKFVSFLQSTINVCKHCLQTACFSYTGASRGPHWGTSGPAPRLSFWAIALLWKFLAPTLETVHRDLVNPSFLLSVRRHSVHGPRINVSGKDRLATAVCPLPEWDPIPLPAVLRPPLICPPPSGFCHTHT